jgi:MscS family membrane protein
VPDTPEGPRYIFYRGDLGRIVIARQADGPRKGSWLFTPETVALVEPMFRAVAGRPVDEASADGALPPPSFWRTPGIWVRLRVPHALPLTWVAAWWILFQMLALLDLPVRVVNALIPFKTFGMAGLIAWLGVHLIDLVTGVYTNSELLRPHRSLSDMIVPVTMRSLKGAILLLVAVYVVYQVGEGALLNRFLTGLGVAGLAASLAAQDALKSFFSTLLLIGERSFKIGDTITVAGLEGVVEQVGFRATRLRTADGSLLTIPNATIATAPIDNRSTKSFTRCTASLLLNYDTAPGRILALRDRIKAWLLGHPAVRADQVDVTVNRLTEEGVEVANPCLEEGFDGADKGRRHIRIALARGEVSVRPSHAEHPARPKAAGGS